MQHPVSAQAPTSPLQLGLGPGAKTGDTEPPVLEGEPWVRGSVGAEAPGRPPGPRPRSARAPPRVPPPSWSEQCECAREPSGGGVESGVGWGIRAVGSSAMHKHQHCCKCPECYEVTRLAALRRLEPPGYGDWQVPDPYGPSGGNGASTGYGGYSSQTLPSQAGATPTSRNKAKLIPTGRDVGPVPPKSVPGKSNPKLNGSGPSWWPECTCTNRDWYEQVWTSRRLWGCGEAHRGWIGGLEGWSTGKGFLGLLPPGSRVPALQQGQDGFWWKFCALCVSNWGRGFHLE